MNQIAHPMSLTNKQRAFINAYITNGYNATEAARTAGYSGSDATLRSIGSENLTKPNIAEKIKEHFESQAMSVEEALARTAEHGRGASASDLAVVFKGFQQGGLPIALEVIEECGISHLVKRVRETKHGLDIELYDAQAALNTILRAHGAFKDSLAVTGKDGESLPIAIVKMNVDEL